MLSEELEKSKADNVKLYGKMRYVQDYNLEKVVSRGSKKVPCVVNSTVVYPQVSFLFLIMFVLLLVTL